MVEETITDGRRIAELLASELSGRSAGTLDAVDVTAANPDAQPESDGATAYAITVHGNVIAEVCLYSNRADIAVEELDRDVTNAFDPSPLIASARASERLTVTPDETAIRIPSGVAVKRAVDAILAGLEHSMDTDAGT